ncbi:hypothetical protein [Paraburkholderia sp. GAS448]|uniref:hypothetical protein n=1 Tax=Paraburkholderia sp. GAS448 TaxID=3035136 RepID=UPI003D256D0F
MLGNLAQPYLTVASMSNGWVNSDLAIDATQTQVVDQFTAEDSGSDKADSHTADFAL